MSTKTRYLIESGQASWHQRGAGHYYASSAVLDLTEEELEKHRSLEKSGRFLAIPWDKLPDTHPVKRAHAEALLRPDPTPPIFELLRPEVAPRV